MEQASYRQQTPIGSSKQGTPRWDGLRAGCLLMLALIVQGCAASGNAGNPITDPPWTQSNNTTPDAGQTSCDSDQDFLPPMYEPKLAELAVEVTQYLNAHCLPLVRASVTKAANGYPQIMLYGFVASNWAKQQAEARTDDLIAFTGIPLTDAIVVRPELASATADRTVSNTVNSPSDSSAAPQPVQQRQNQDPNGSLTIPLASPRGPGIIGNVGGSGMLVAPGTGP